MNAHVKFVQGFVRIEIDKWAVVKKAAEADTVAEVLLDPNFSEIEYEMVRLDEDEKVTDDQNAGTADRGRGRGRGGRGRGDYRGRGGQRGGRGGQHRGDKQHVESKQTEDDREEGPSRGT